MFLNKNRGVIGIPDSYRVFIAKIFYFFAIIKIKALVSQSYERRNV